MRLWGRASQERTAQSDESKPIPKFFSARLDTVQTYQNSLGPQIGRPKIWPNGHEVTDSGGIKSILRGEK